MRNKDLKEEMQRSMTGTEGGMQDNTVEDQDFTGIGGADRPVKERVEDVLSGMSLNEKIDFISGYKIIALNRIPSAGLPTVWMSDASAGIRSFGTATAFPSPIAMTASWNRKLINRVADALGEEARSRGVSILLAPGINIYRVPTCGRNFEYMGEDPYLTGEMVVPYIKGVQDRGVITTVKHLACNNSDYDRHRTNSVVDERTLREIYLPAFKKAVQEGKSGGVMSSYNPINGKYGSENYHLITEILREEWGFDGFVVSDWWSVYSTEGPIKAGLDLEMPDNTWLNKEKIIPLIEAGKVTEEEISNMVRRILTVFFRFGVYDRVPIDTQSRSFGPEHSQTALDMARESITLLKNEKSLLPLAPADIKKIVLAGPLALDTPAGGGGSAFVKKPSEEWGVLKGVKHILGEDVDITVVPFQEGGDISAEYIDAVREADAIIASVGFTPLEESECYERPWELPYGQEELLQNLGALNARTIAVVTAGAGFRTEPWIDSVSALVMGYYLGQNAGRALADVLFGVVNPSGRLPFTMAKRWNDFLSTSYYVEHPDATSSVQMNGDEKDLEKVRVWDMTYGEELMVGYRHFTTNNVQPRFPFGYGLSYTSFKISDLKLDSNTIKGDEELNLSVKVTNSGDTAGFHTVQIYVHDVESSLPRPVRELKGFEKIHLDAGESKTVGFVLKREDLSFFDPKSNHWTAEPGEFIVYASSHSLDTDLSASFRWESDS